MLISKQNGESFISLQYYNGKKLNVCDFIESIKEDLLKILSKNRGFAEEKQDDDIDVKYAIQFRITYEIFDDGTSFCYYPSTKFGVNGICVNKFTKDLINCANENYEKYGGKFFCFGEEFDIKKFDEKSTINFFDVTIWVNYDRITHKEKFYKKLHDEIVESAWQPSRYLGFEELRALQERWPQSK